MLKLMIGKQKSQKLPLRALTLDECGAVGGGIVPPYSFGNGCDRCSKNKPTTWVEISAFIKGMFN